LLLVARQEPTFLNGALVFVSAIAQNLMQSLFAFAFSNLAAQPKAKMMHACTFTAHVQVCVSAADSHFMPT